ncbi:hypothetical protein C499_19555 [Halogeometricum borinquense DSM 11551]|uniref:Uncharacterized protein n=1 Tax=Halogeometricum borinquense (strain ATCC 700274 / DSM 11551 / JCM 10706 / KCTC 4070 / PR3) TaxID=469382 RepID=E4NWS5_HALBP|nr:hypothetical protein [Halogeometricum borinquense]ADQ69495.1 hypothetical protein Hbor_37900 [Halogeometricum borinquense DSM 11551]ELY23051.1 hypothetical protein C499_19555 [Halogeometricum borinquense DSM 11551]
MAGDEVPDVEAGTEELLDEAEEIDSDDGMTARMRRENQLLGRAVDYVAAWSEDGAISSANANALADALASELAHYTKTDIKDEFTDVFVDDGSGANGIPFDELIEQRLQEVKVVSTTDAKQGLVWRWHFSDGVQLETEKSKDEGRKHYDWTAWKEDYFEALISLGKGERIAPPSRERRDSNDWKEFLSEILLDRAETVEHVGPRTEAVEHLRDYVNRQTAYADVKDMRDRQGIWMDAPPADDDGEAATDGGGPSQIRVPTQAVKRICDQAGIETRALQIELDARSETLPDVAGVSDYEYVDGQRVSFWCLDAGFAEPAEFVEEPESPAEQAAREQEEEAEEAQTDVGAVDDKDDSDGTESEQETDDVTEDGDEGDEDAHDGPATSDETESAEDDVDGHTEDERPPEDAPDDGPANDFESGITGGFGIDPDDDDEGGE